MTDLYENVRDASPALLIIGIVAFALWRNR